MRYLSIFLSIVFVFGNSISFASPKPVPTAATLYINEDENSSTIAISRIAFNIPAVKSMGKVGIINMIGRCNLKRDYHFDSTTKFNVDESYYTQTFLEMLQQAKYNLPNSLNDMFQTKKKPPEYLIAASINEFDIDYCVSGLPARSKKGKGELYNKIEWQVYSLATEEIVYKKVTEGYHRIKKKTDNVFNILLDEAFKSSLRNLLATDDLAKILSSRKKQENEEPLEPFETILVNYIIDEEQRPLDTLEQSVVGIKTLGGTGSGFVISNDGYILTNHHVIRGYDTASIVFSNGMEIDGKVIRSDKDRDIALIKIPLKNLKPVQINGGIPRVGSKAYVMGAPKGLQHQGTLSSGIISAIREDPDGNDLIQSDTNITFGNSGGPMFDDQGHVIGVSVSGSIEVDFANYFIPIESALDTLSIMRPDAD